MPKPRLTLPRVLLAAIAACVALACTANAAAAAPRVADYSCSHFSVGGWQDWGSEDSNGNIDVSMGFTGGGDCTANGTRYANAGISLSGNGHVSCSGGSITITGTLSLSDGVNPAVSTGATVQFSGTGNGADGTITLASGQTGPVATTMTRPLIRPSDYCEPDNEPINMSIYGSFVATASTAECAKFASPNGNDANAGTAAAPYQTPGKLATSLLAGQTGCLDGGSYTQDLTLTNNDTTLESTPGETATWKGRIVVKGSGITLRYLHLDGRNTQSTTCKYDTPPCPQPSPDIENNNDSLIGNDITTNGTATDVSSHGICVSINNFYGTTPAGTVIDGNVIHNCGYPTAAEEADGGHWHGIYVTHGNGTTITNNVFYANADRAIQLWPDAQHTTIDHNTIDSNGEGIDFGSAGSTASSDNNATHNIVTNSTIRWNVYTDWEAATGARNTFANNCVFATNSGYTQDGGIAPQRAGVTFANNTVADPRYVNAANHDYRVQNGSCSNYGANPQNNP